MSTYAAPRSATRPDLVFVRRRLVVLAVLVVLLVAAFTAFSGTVGADAPVRTEAYVVAPGDTLWEIASDRTSPDGDVRLVMADIAEINGLTSTDLVVGQRLHLPAGS